VGGGGVGGGGGGGRDRQHVSRRLMILAAAGESICGPFLGSTASKGNEADRWKSFGVVRRDSPADAPPEGRQSQAAVIVDHRQTKPVHGVPRAGLTILGATAGDRLQTRRRRRLREVVGWRRINKGPKETRGLLQIGFDAERTSFVQARKLTFFA